MKKHIFILSLVSILAVTACRDDPDPPPPHPGYTITGQLMNGTTMQPVFPGLVMTLRVSYSDPWSVEREDLGQCTVRNDGRFEITYQHSKLAERTGSWMRFESQFYFSEGIPKNQDLTKTFYESTWGNIHISIQDVAPFDTIYWAFKNEQDSMVFGEIDPAQSFSTLTRYFKPGLNVFYDSIPLDYDAEENWFYGHPRSKRVNLTGDPFTDTLNIEF